MLAQQTCVGLLAIPNSGSVHENCFCAHILLRFRNRKPGKKSIVTVAVHAFTIWCGVTNDENLFNSNLFLCFKSFKMMPDKWDM